VESAKTLEISEGGTWVDAETFAQFAERDLRRWRPAVGCAVVPANDRWGDGVLESVSWASPRDGVEAYTQIRSRYAAGWKATSRAETWASHHLRIRVPDELRAAIVECSDPSLPDEERARRRERHAQRFQDAYDEQLLERTARLKRRARGGQRSNDTAR